MKNFFFFIFLAFLWSLILTSCTASWSGDGWPVFSIDGDKAAGFINEKINKPSYSEPVK